ncbi:hydantoinase/oxoprolinase family protein [Novosphingobium naphthalenivorans]|uniref:hydantoinase/oxoprolinase family protein n=1 Tax=Novosphingobium naphthalenivorans TaxID=273168 RepID=UPI00082A8A30|nr:hydantoinase/oxoprolinase family protein [Novosphingobium naphthalenivorans]
MAFQINIDNGGTLTDVCIMSDEGVSKTKVLTTPYDLSKCFFEGLQKASEVVYGAADVKRLLEEVDLIRYSTTQGTNAICERKGPKLGLILNSGAAALPAALRAHDPEVFDALVGDRVGFIEPAVLDTADAEVEIVKVINKLATIGANRLVVCFADADFHKAEEKIKAIVLRKYPRHLLGAVPVLYASDLTVDANPDRRAWSALINSFLHPSMEAFLYNAENRLRAYRTKNPLLIFRNDGDASRVAKTVAIKTYSSGPRGGMEGVKAFAGLYGFRDAVSIDVGGTTTDIGQCTEGQVAEMRRGHVEGISVSFPLCEIESAGAGGSSIFRVKDGAITIGPDSVGALPGPACFGRGGKEATITDASLLAGLFDPSSYFGGGMGLDVARAEAAVRTNIADPLGVDVDTAVIAMIDAFEAKVAAELHHFTSIAPDTVMLAFGGAGPLSACGIAEKAGIGRVAIPAMAAVFSAYGIGSCDISQRYVVELDEHDTDAMQAVLAALKQKAARDMFAEGFGEGSYAVSARLVAETPTGEMVEPIGDMAEFPASLASATTVELELIAVKSLRQGDARHVAFTRKTEAKPAATRNVLVPGKGRIDLPVYHLAAMAPGDWATGPAILEEDYFTSRVPAGWTFVVSDAGDIILDQGE